MKKLIQSIFTVAFALTTAMTFNSCEDVPAPYSIPDDPSSPDTPSTEVEPTGSGTLADPYNVAAAEQYIENGGSEEAEVYVKGIVVSVKSDSYDPAYGSLKYYISDDGTSTNQFYVYNGYYGPNRTQFSGEDALKAGDVVVICGKLVEYSGTKEFTTGNYLVELNGKSTTGSDPAPVTPSTEAKGTGTQADPYNCAAAISYIKTLTADVTSENDVYIKGKVVEITENYGVSSYGNATYYIADDANGTNKFYVFRSLYKDNAKYSSGDILSVGDDVVVCGKVVNYKGNTPETATNKSYLYSHTKNGGTSEPETPTTGDAISISGTTVTLTNTAVTAGTETITLDLSTLGYENAQEVTSLSLSDGTTITLDANGGSTTPKYYTATKGIRFYANNKIVFTGKSPIAKIVLTCDSYNGTDYVGNATATLSASGNTLTYINAHTSNSGGVQLRIKTIKITYAQ